MKKPLLKTLSLFAVLTLILTLFAACVAPAPAVSQPAQGSQTDGSTFSVHFIDVGQADAALVECDGEYMLIDGGNRADSNLIYSVLQREGVNRLSILVATHAHEDHIGGLPGAFNYATADLTLCPVTEHNSGVFKTFAQYAEEKGGGITVPAVGDTYRLGSATVVILGVNGGEDTNDTSIILKITYGSTSFLFTGDAEGPAEETVLNSGADLSATVLKVGHHGSAGSTSYRFLREIMPEYAVISVGTDNSYGHPTEEALSRLRDAGAKVYRTDLQGDIYVTSDGETVTVTTDRNSQSDTLGTAAPTITPEPREYVLNTSSRKFHLPDCSGLEKMNPDNRKDYTGTAEELMEMGYTPCGSCEP